MQKNIRNEILNYSKGYHLSTFFKYVDHEFGGIKNNPDIKNIFLKYMTEFMKSGDLKLANKGKYLEGEIEEQVYLFHQAWPDHYDENDPKYDIDNLWWYVYAPAGAVWIYPDGWEEWT